MIKIFFSLFLILMFSCQKHNEGSTPEFQKSENIKDEDFDIFLDKFSADSIFQISRVNFPIKTVQFDTDKLREDTLEFNQSNYHFNKIDKQSKYYKIEKIIASNFAKVLLKGIDNGIYIEFFFSKRNGNWKLDTWKDSST